MFCGGIVDGWRNLLLVTFLLFPQQVDNTAPPPNVTISYADVPDYDFYNETFAVMSNSNAAFVLLCNASYPVEWIFHYDKVDDGTSEKVKVANTYRTVEEFDKPETYRYSAKLRIQFNGKRMTLTNYTCQGSLKPSSYQTHVYMGERDDKSILILEVSSGEYKGEEEEESQPALDGDCSRALAQVQFSPGNYNVHPCWRCLEPETGRELLFDFQSCKTPIQCNSIHGRQRAGLGCLRTVHVQELAQDCLTGFVAFFPRIVLCKNYGPALAQFYFFGVYKGQGQDGRMAAVRPPIFFSWAGANPDDMVYIHPIQEKVHLGEQIEFRCEYSRYYFSLGSWFGVRKPSGALEYIPGDDIKPCDTDFEERNIISNPSNCNGTWQAKRLGTYYATLQINFKEIGPHQVYCFGPVWNTTQWDNASHSFWVEMGEIPHVISLVADSNEGFLIGQENRSLHCAFKGRPVPRVRWEGPEDTFWEPAMTTSNSSVLRLREIGWRSTGNYSCGVSSFLGNHSRGFRIQSGLPRSDEKLSAGAVSGIVVGCVLLLMLVLGLIGRLIQIILRQRRELRPLTDSEVEDFVHGKPENASDVVDSEFAINALAFDKRYEIEPGKLVVDYNEVLGEGQFAIVYKGRLDVRGMDPHIVFGENGGNEELQVSVKIPRKNIDVTSFKETLTEVKVHAYVGRHENIVSLLGVDIHNFWDRKLRIALEFCENGSLKDFLRRNKKHFVNYVKFGRFRGKGKGSSPYCDLAEVFGRKGETSSGWKFSTLTLFLWTYHMAKGLEYLHSKRVIHRDLAIRNMLLTKDFTAKLGDFGLSRLGRTYVTKTQGPLPWANMAVESLKYKNFSLESDIWSLGVTIWELFTLGDTPYGGRGFSDDFLRELESGELRLLKPQNATNDLYELLLMMWEGRPEKRPRIFKVKRLCKNLFKKAGLSVEEK